MNSPTEPAGTEEARRAVNSWAGDCRAHVHMLTNGAVLLPEDEADRSCTAELVARLAPTFALGARAETLVQALGVARASLALIQKASATDKVESVADVALIALNMECGQAIAVIDAALNSIK